MTSTLDRSFLDQSLRVAPLAPSVKDGQAIRESRGYRIAEEDLPRSVIHDLAGLAAATHE